MSDMHDFLMIISALQAVLCAYAAYRAAQERGTRAPADEVPSTRSRPAWDDGLSDWDILRASGRPGYWI
jgi:hypothetical protein